MIHHIDYPPEFLKDSFDTYFQPMTEEQKMEEGKKMFSIFAARMFEQRVLQAYREKVAQERQLQSLRELEDEDKASKEKEAKKQTQNQKKKDKKRYVFVSFCVMLLNIISLFVYVGNKKWPKRVRRLPKLPKRPLKMPH
jgi:hypothetical protein